MRNTSTPSHQDDVAWWSLKVRAVGTRCFGSSASHWAGHLYDRLAANPSVEIGAADYQSLARSLGVPRKFLSRAVATLTRCGILTGTLSGPIALAFHPDLLTRRKNAAQAHRRRLTLRDRERILKADRFRCGRCGRRFDPGELEVDHIVPISLLGADVPANWMSMCRRHNREKWDGFDRGLKHYRGEPVVGSVRLHFEQGLFWPVINGRIRKDAQLP